MSRLPNPMNHPTEQQKMLLEKMEKKRGHIDGMYLTLLNHPDLTEKVSDLGGFLRFGSTLKGKYREFIILYCARKFDAEYEWIKHLPHAIEEGVGQALIDTIHQGAEHFEEPYESLVAVANCALKLENIPKPLQDRAIDIVGVEGLLEVVTLVNFYRMIAGIIFCFDVPLPEKVS
ncbi:MAG: carboxymuconolactone decarboxylase family protein [Chlamydiales bacterium]|nr:carboxymuconolactone decarboxylase family protein [Chlamydiia bacterium]MCP5506806.1 carboxymuconolactone decarboxylase family protein [Chlamydiales bacterium]